MAEVKKGTRIGSYTIIEGLAGGKGGMATVFRAQTLNRKSRPPSKSAVTTTNILNLGMLLNWRSTFSNLYAIPALCA